MIYFPSIERILYMGHVVYCDRCGDQATTGYTIIVPIDANSSEYRSGDHDYQDITQMSKAHSKGRTECTVYRCNYHPLEGKWYRMSNVTVKTRALR